MCEVDMKKILYSLLIVFTIFTWINTINKNHETTELNSKLILNGDIYFEKQIFKDAIENYEKARKIEDSNELKSKIQEAMFLDQQYETAFEYALLTNTEDSKNMQYKILQSLYENEEYKIINNLLKVAQEDIRQKFTETYNYEFKVLENEFLNLNYLPIDNDYFIVDYYNKSSIVNNNSKLIESLDEGEILSVNYPYYTVKDKKSTLVFDFENNIRANIESLNVDAYQEGVMVMNREKYIDRTGQDKSDIYVKSSNFNDGMALVKEDRVSIIDLRFKTIKTLEATDFKVDSRNNGIYSNTIILKNDNYQIYNIKKDKYSDYYEDIDFNYGEYIAVKNNGKWGYIDQEFNLIIDYKYDQAESFSCGIGLVYIDGKQYMIDENNNIIKELENKIMPFNKDGISFMLEEENYKMIKLLRFIND